MVRKYDLVRRMLAEEDKLIMDDPYYNTVPEKERRKIELRQWKYILELEDDEETKQLVKLMAKRKNLK